MVEIPETVKRQNNSEPNSKMDEKHATPESTTSAPKRHQDDHRNEEDLIESAMRNPADNEKLTFGWDSAGRLQKRGWYQPEGKAALSSTRQAIGYAGGLARSGCMP